MVKNRPWVKGREQITHRGIPSKEAIFFPPVHRIEDTTDKLGWGTKNKIWDWDDLIKFIFPPTASPRYYEMATEFMKYLADNIQYDEETEKIIGLTGEDISQFVKTNGYSGGSFYGYVLRKLHDAGLVERRREERKRRSDTGSWMGKMLLEPSRQFITHLNRIAEWNTRLLETAVDNAKKKKKSSELAQITQMGQSQLENI